MDTASVRINLAMCQREDMSKFLEEARVALAGEKKRANPILRLVVDNTSKG
jgi:hypothetical protein